MAYIAARPAQIGDTAMALTPNSKYGPWFAEPPVVGGPDKYTVVHATGAQAQALGNNGNPGFTTQAEAQAYATQQDNTFALSGNPLKAAEQVATGNTTQQGSSGNPLSGLAAIGAFFAGLSEKNTWVRVAKVVVGGAMVLIGLAKLTGLDDKVAGLGKAVAAAPLL